MTGEDTKTDRKIDRKANTPTVEKEEGDPRAVDDRRPDLEHFDGFEGFGGKSIRERIPTLPRPDVSVVGVAMGSLYAAVVVGALSVAYGATSLAAAHGGVYVALIVGGIFAFAYGYVGLRAADAVTTEPPTEPYE